MSDNFFHKNAPTLCTAGSIISFVTTAANVVYATVKTLRAVEKEEKILNRKLTFKEKAKVSWYYWVAPATELAMGIGLGVAANRISNAKQLALAAAYTSTEATLQVTQKKIPEIFGDKSAQKIKEAVSEEITKNVVKETEENNKKITYLSNPNDESTTRFVEPFTRQVFYSTWDKVREAANKINNNALMRIRNVVDITGVTITLNDWLLQLGLESVDSEVGDDIGWKVGENQLLEVSMAATVINNEPCGEIFYDTRPTYLY